MDEGDLGHDEAGFGEEAGVVQADDAVPDERRVAVHAETGEETTGKAGGFVNAREGIGVDDEGDGGRVLPLGLVTGDGVLADVGLGVGMAGAADLEEFEGLPCFDVTLEARLGVGRELELRAGAVLEVLEELFEDEFLEVVLGVADDLPGGDERFAVREGRSGGEDQQVGGAQGGEIFDRALVVGVEVDGGAVFVWSCKLIRVSGQTKGQ